MQHCRITSKIFFIFLVSLYFSSCAAIFNGAVLPNQCKRCELIDMRTNTILFENEGCGSENTKLEEEAQLKAYELSRNNYNLCDLDVVCKSWRKSPNENE